MFCIWYICIYYSVFINVTNKSSFLRTQNTSFFGKLALSLHLFNCCVVFWPAGYSYWAEVPVAKMKQSSDFSACSLHCSPAMNRNTLCTIQHIIHIHITPSSSWSWQEFSFFLADWRRYSYPLFLQRKKYIITHKHISLSTYYADDV